jgi:hypothetical protein
MGTPEEHSKEVDSSEKEETLNEAVDAELSILQVSIQRVMQSDLEEGRQVAGFSTIIFGVLQLLNLIIDQF